MNPSGISINPPARVKFNGEIHHVRNAKVSLSSLNLSPEDEQLFLEAVHSVDPRLVKGGRGPLASQVKAFISSWLASDRSSVDQEIIDKRAEICRSCKFKTEITTGCKNCSSFARMIFHAPKVPVLDGLACEKCGCYLSVKVTQPAQVLRADERRINYPDHCWVPDASSDESI